MEIKPYYSIDEVKKTFAELEKRANEEHFISRKQVLNEIGKDIKDGSKNTLASMLEGVRTFIDTQKIVYAFPSYGHGEPEYGKLTSLDDLGIALDVAQVLFYTINFADRIIPEHALGFEHNYWLIPVVTNTISALYEAGKNYCKKTEKKLIEDNSKGIKNNH
jgi:hypothetical protein